MGWIKRNRSRYVIGSEGRAGTGLLAHALWSTGVLGRPEEYFNQPDLETYAAQWHVDVPRTESDSADYIGAYNKASSSPNGVSGLKVMTGSLSTIGELTGCQAAADPTEILLSLGISIVFLILRKDKVATAVSKWRAQQTGEFKRFQGRGAVSSAEIGLPSDETMQLLIDESDRADSYWSSLDSERIAVHEFVYEDFSQDIEGTVAQIADQLGIRRAQISSGARLPLRITDERLEGFIADYKQRHADEPPTHL
jgi:LPS sulfotransferase NodH